MSADEGWAAWRFVGVGVCRLVVLQAGERIARGVDGVSLEAESGVGVGGGDGAAVCVAEEFLDHDEFDFLLQEQGRWRVSEDVKADAVETGLAEERDKGASEYPRNGGTTTRQRSFEW